MTASTVPGMTRRLILAAAVMLAGPAGCSDEPPRPPAADTSTAPTSTPAPTPSPTAEPTHQLGDTVAMDGVTVTVFRYKGAGTLDGERLGAVEVKACNTAAVAYEVSTGPWSFLFADDTVSDSAQAWSGVTTPEYPFNARTLRPGKCVRGWMTFALSGGKRPAYVEYAPGGLAGEPAPAPVGWRIGA